MTPRPPGPPELPGAAFWVALIVCTLVVVALFIAESAAR